MRYVYLALCIAGLIVPNIAFVPWFLEHGLDVRLMFRELFANRISTFFGLDLIITALVVFVFAYAERRRLRGRWWIPVAGTVLVGVSFGLPLLLYLREISHEDVVGR